MCAHTQYMNRHKTTYQDDNSVCSQYIFKYQPTLACGKQCLLSTQKFILSFHLFERFFPQTIQIVNEMNGL